MSESLRKRVLTAVVLAAALLVILLWLPQFWTVAALTAMVLAGAWEWSAFLRAPAVAWRLLYVALVAALLPLAWRVAAVPGVRDLILMAAVLWWVAALMWIVFAPRLVAPWAAALAGVLALVPSWTSARTFSADASAACASRRRSRPARPGKGSSAAPR